MPADTQRLAKSLRVLLVEDYEEDAELLVRHIRRAGFNTSFVRVETEEAMREALQSAGGAFDVVLADYTLPTFSAPEALKLLKSSGFDIPFIMMSGAVSEETAVSAMRAGAHDYVSKQNLVRLVPAIEREIVEAGARRARNEAERALHHAEERFHRLVDAMPIGLLISDNTGRITYANDAVEKLLGYSQMEISSGTVTLERICPTPVDAARPTHSLWTANREPYEVECVTRKGEHVPILIGSAILNPEAAPENRQLAAFLADLSDQKRSHDILRRTEKLAAAGRLAASIAHEINNPLESVVNCLYLLKQSELDENGKQFLALAQRELDRVIHITTQTLRFYRQSTRPVRTDVHELLETVLALYDARLRSFGIRVERDFDELPSVIAFEGEVRQVLANLIGNAVDAMQASGGRLLLRTSCTQDWATGNRGIAFTVADTGPGMDAATLKRIFEPFFSTKGITGTGLGLWISSELVTKHRGKIQVRSRQASGTSRLSGSIFRIFLPTDPVISLHSPENGNGPSPFLEASA